MRINTSILFQQKVNEIQSRVPLKLFNERQSFKGIMENVQNKPQENTEDLTPVDYSRDKYKELISSASEKYGIDNEIIEAVIKAESGFNPNAVSAAGAVGLMQLMPATATGLGVTNAFDPKQNIDGGVRYLSELLSMYDWDLKTALAAYNCGCGTLASLGIDNLDSNEAMSKLYRETRDYVNKVINNIK